jgi:uridine monophosphate synthetase
MGFFTTLEERARQIDSLLCVGLDPHPAELAAPTAAAARQFCLRLIEATADLALAFKPNAAFFEAFGPEGLQALMDVNASVPEGIPVILDAKRGDIASTAEAYARSAFQVLKAGAVTANPYLGSDALAPFLEDPQRGVFLLCKTSNPGSADLQDLPVIPGAGQAPRRLYEQVARLAQDWNQHDNLGLVVGATHPQALRDVRQVAPDLWILAPGVGAQGGELGAAMQSGLRRDGLGLLLAVSRAISRANNPRAAAQKFVEEMRRYARGDKNQGTRDQGRGEKVLPLPPYSPIPYPLNLLADDLLKAGCVKFGQYTLKSGLVSPIYLDLRMLVSYPPILSRAAAAYVEALRGLSFDRLAALPYAALPIGTAISLQSGWPLVYPRKEAKGYGTQTELEGVYTLGETVVVIDDLATTGGSKFEAIEKLAGAGLTVRDVVVLIDRLSGAREALTQAGYQLHAVFTLTALLDYWEYTGQVPAEQVSVTREFLKR